MPTQVEIAMVLPDACQQLEISELLVQSVRGVLRAQQVLDESAARQCDAYIQTPAGEMATGP